MFFLLTQINIKEQDKSTLNFFNILNSFFLLLIIDVNIDIKFAFILIICLIIFFYFELKTVRRRSFFSEKNFN